jgi:sigma-B regulation protein RsbU (phosphoserine phosphatase)
MLCLGEKDSLSGYDPKELEKLTYFQVRSNDFISTAITYKKSMKEQIIARTINLSSAILTQALPDSLPNMHTIKFGAFTVPKYSQGSDYFDFLRPGSQGIGVFAADVAGVGINNALISVLLRSALHAQIAEAPSSHSVMQNINKILYNYSGGRGGLITAFYFYFDTKSMRISYTNAGYPGLEIFRVEKNNFDVLDTEGIPLGYDDITSYGTGRTNLLRGDIGILYSKTLVNSKNQKAEKFGISRLRRIIIDNRSRHPSEITVALKNVYNDFMGVALPDSDINVIIFKIV